jgi:hypothetical protein
MKSGLRRVDSRSRLIAILFACVVFLSIFCLAAKEFVKPAPQPAKTYPAHDSHPTEAITVAIDPYDVPDKAQIFSVKYQEEGFLPVFLIVSNDGDQPISLTGMKPQLVTVNRTMLSAATTDDLYRRLAHPARRDNPYPLPFPRTKMKGAVGKKAMDEIEAAQFGAKAVEPHITQSGFLFFDVSGLSTPLAGAHFFLTGVRDAKGNEVMFFEIPLEKYLSAPASKP